MTKRLAAWAAILAIGLAGGAGRASDAALAEEGNREYAAGDFAKALEVYDRALENAAPAHRAPLLFNRANALYRLGRLAEAEEAYREAAAADGGLSRDSAFNQGNAAWQAARERMEKEPQKALDDLMRGEALYRRALEQAPGDPDSAYNLDLVRREIQKLRERLPPPQQQQQNQDQKQDKNPQDQKQEQKQGDQGQPDQQKKPEDSPAPQGQQKDQERSPDGQNEQDQKEQGKDESKPNPQDQQGGQGEQKDEQKAPQDAQKPGERPDKQQSPDDPGKQGQRQPQAGERPEPPQDQRDEGKDGQEGEKQGEKTPQEKPADQKDGQNGEADGQEKPDERQDAPKRPATAKQAQGAPRDKDDPDAKTAEQILQREKEDRERRAKARRRHAAVEKDW